MNRIRNYNELIAARRLTENLIAERKQVIRDNVQDVRGKLEPIMNVVNIFKKSDHSVLKVGTALAIDLFIGQKMLSKASWFTRLLVPALLKTVSSRVIKKMKKT